MDVEKIQICHMEWRKFVRNIYLNVFIIVVIYLAAVNVNDFV